MVDSSFRYIQITSKPQAGEPHMQQDINKITMAHAKHRIGIKYEACAANKGGRQIERERWHKATKCN